AVDFQLKQGGIATSGDLYRFLQKDGVRYSHILNPVTGWPVTKAPHTITVFAASCIEAGILATVAMLQGKKATKFLKHQDIKYWVS
ncbi:MAG: FAD:protein FMN transferase, partial [Woeseiaceae bacterium]